jgi:hypothetical protein
MSGFTDKILSKFDQLSTRVGVLNSIVDAVVGRIAPESSANAHCPYPCSYTECYFDVNCCNIPGSNCSNPYRNKRWCAGSNYECTHNIGVHLHNECHNYCWNP